MNSSDDIIIALRANNGKCPKCDDFWEVVANFIAEKTAVNNRRHNNSDGEGELVLNLAMANSYADMYQQCVEISKTKDIIIPSYAWFLLQFWPTTKTASNILHYTSRFKVKKMVQARILRKTIQTLITLMRYTHSREKGLSNLPNAQLLHVWMTSAWSLLGNQGSPLLSSPVESK